MRRPDPAHPRTLLTRRSILRGENVAPVMDASQPFAASSAAARRGLTPGARRRIHGLRFRECVMLKPRAHIRHICRTFYLSEWWDE